MICKNVIAKTFEEIIEGKCGYSRKQIISKLSKYSHEEKVELMDGRLNDGEWERYNRAYKNIVEMEKVLKEVEGLSDDEPYRVGEFPSSEYFSSISNMKEIFDYRLNKYNKIIYEYEKRIVTDYKINQNPVPDIDKSLFIESDNGDRQGISFTPGPVEERMMLLQREHGFTDFEKAGLREWWGDGHDNINRSLYGGLYSYELGSDSFMKNLSRTKRAITSAINKGEGLVVPTVLFHGGRFDISLNPGDHFNWKGYVSMSFHRKVPSKFSGGLDKFTYICYTPAGVKGVCMNDRETTGNYHTTEHEYLVDKGMGATVLSVDYDNKVVEVLVDEP